MSDDERKGAPVPVRDSFRQLSGAAEPGAPQPAPALAFALDDEEWVARLAGEGVHGAGRVGTAHLVAVHFYRQGEERPLREALVPARRFHGLFPAELRELCRTATPIQHPDDG